VRLAEEDEKRRREEEEGKYEVSRILEVKFPKNNKDKKEFLIRSVVSLASVASQVRRQ
jgi:hypothetical protein